MSASSNPTIETPKYKWPMTTSYTYLGEGFTVYRNALEYEDTYNTIDFDTLNMWGWIDTWEENDRTFWFFPTEERSQMKDTIDGDRLVGIFTGMSQDRPEPVKTFEKQEHYSLDQFDMDGSVAVLVKRPSYTEDQVHEMVSKALDRSWPEESKHDTEEEKLLKSKDARERVHAILSNPGVSYPGLWFVGIGKRY